MEITHYSISKIQANLPGGSSEDKVSCSKTQRNAFGEALISFPWPPFHAQLN